MKFAITFLSIFYSFSHYLCSPSPPYEVHWIDQYLDHFNFEVRDVATRKNTFKQRFLVYDKWWKAKGGPIFFYTGNESPIDAFWNNTGFLFDIAEEFQALIVFGEHRYYGESLPFGKESFRRPFIGYLSVAQALADYAYMLTHIRKKYDTGVYQPVITFGGSYGGMLSAYMRFKYPNIVDGAIAASAPIYKCAGLTPPQGFFQAVTQTFDKSGTSCVSAIKNAFKELFELADQSEGLAKISSIFKTCKPLVEKNELVQLSGWIRNSFTNLAMFDYPYQTDMLAKLPAFPVKLACKLVSDASSLIEGLALAAGVFYNGTEGSLKCFDIYSEFVACSDPTGCGTGPVSYAWDYQGCTEMVLAGGSDNITDMFPNLPFTLNDRDDYCSKKWFIQPRVDWLYINMLGNKITSASNIVFSNGELDPWSEGGVLSNLSDTLIALGIKDAAHHLDLRGSNKDDPESVIEARAIEKKYIKKWIDDAINLRTS